MRQPLVELPVPPELDVHLILDNDATHKTPAIRRWFVKRPRFQVHFTPPAASWRNRVERWFAALTEKHIRRGSFRSTRELETAIGAFLDHHNIQPKPFVWTKSADAILNSLARSWRRMNDSGHSCRISPPN